jgi:hypothetical protein
VVCRFEQFSQVICLLQCLFQTTLLPVLERCGFAQGVQDLVQHSVVLERESSSMRPPQRTQNNRKLISQLQFPEYLFLQRQIRLRASFMQTLQQRGQLAPFVVLLNQRQCFQHQRFASRDLRAAIDMHELDFFFAEGCVGGVVFEFLFEFVAEDEVALAFV